MDANDHDLLVELRTSMRILIENQTQFYNLHRELAERVVALEIKDRGDSERVKAITTDLQRSLNNHERLNEHHAQIESIKEDVLELKKRSNMWDIANSVLATIAGIIGFAR